MEHPTDTPTCNFCRKRAIGMQILGCCKQEVCEDHAEEMLRSLKPGERKDWGACYYVRYPEEPESGEDNSETGPD